jgi:hypothetical protein
MEKMSMKATEIGAWLRQMAGKRDHREALRDDYPVPRVSPLSSPPVEWAKPVEGESSAV